MLPAVMGARRLKKSRGSERRRRAIPLFTPFASGLFCDVFVRAAAAALKILGWSNRVRDDEPKGTHVVREWVPLKIKSHLSPEKSINQVKP